MLFADGLAVTMYLQVLLFVPEASPQLADDVEDTAASVAEDEDG